MAGLHQGLDVLVAFEVGVAGLDELIHGELLLFEDELLDSAQGVNNGAEAHEFKVAEIDAFGDLFLMEVDAVLHAQIVHGGAHGLGEMLSTELVDDVLLNEGGA